MPAPHPRRRPRRQRRRAADPASSPDRPRSSSTPSTIPGLQGVAPVMDIRAVLRKVEPSVVAIETGLVSQNGGIFGRGAGTGVIISADGLVLTNNHVIEEADSIKVKMSDGRELNADLVGSSPADDVALIKIRDVSGLTAAELGSSAQPPGRRPGRRDRQRTRPARAPRRSPRASSPRSTVRSTRAAARKASQAASRSATSSRPTPRSTRATRAVRS